jgi:hypothetical protein
MKCSKRQLSLPADFGVFNAPSLELDVEHVHYASFTATLANMIIDYESELRVLCTVLSDMNY